MMEETIRKRRIRYKGKYPRNFEEKYKELNPEKYKDTIQHVIGKGKTPAGMHIPILLDEILSFFAIKPGMNGLDVTLGYGGHSLKILSELNHQGKLWALDVDPIEIEKTKQRIISKGFTEKDFSAKLLNFSKIDEIIFETGKFDFVLADLGVSSMQIDNPQRGFTYKREGCLDLRMNPLAGISAAELLKKLSLEELEIIFKRNSDEPYAKEIAKKIKSEYLKKRDISTTQDLCRVIDEAFRIKKIKNDEKKEQLTKTYKRIFQALRIEVNNEFGALNDFLMKLPAILNPKGKIAILTFHSGEDRMVKDAFKAYKNEGFFSLISEKVIRPSAEECRRNPRAHSTKMRWAIV